MARKAYSLEMAMEKPEEVEELYISGLNLKSLPEKIFQLRNLKKLDFSKNSLTEIPKEFTQLKKLTELNFYSNNLTDSIFTFLTSKNFPHFKTLNLGKNKITTFPNHFFQFKNLIDLDISRNKIKVISSDIIQLENLTSLIASNNLITSLPEEISKLKNLNYLWLINNPLERLPTNFEEINNLISLELSISKDFSTEYFHTQLKYVKRLYLKGDKKVAIPNNVFRNQNLENLSLTDFGASIIDFPIGELPKLRRLTISRSNLKSLPDGIGFLNSLEKLAILNSHLKRLPSSLVNLGKLRKFNFVQNDKDSPEINRFLKKIKHETFPTHLKEAAFNFIFSKDNSLDNLSKKELLILAQFPFQNLGKAIENLLYQKHSLDILKNPFGKNTHFALLGKTNLNFKKIKSHLKNISKKITPQTTHVVLGKLPGEIDNLASRDFVFVRESELNLWVQQQENPYLLSSSEAEIENLSRLLLSFQEENIEIALQIMKTGGIPTALLTDLVIVFKKLKTGRQKRVIRKLLSLHLSEAALRVVSLKTGLLKAEDLEKKILELADETVLDGLKISKFLTVDKK